MRLTAVMTILILLALSPAFILANPGSTFKYQGKLSESGAPLSGTVSLQFSLFDAASGGNAVGTTTTLFQEDILVTDGLINTKLDFGSAAFDGSRRWLEISVDSDGTSGPTTFETLTPRIEIHPTPYSMYSQTAGSVLNDAVDDADADPTNELNSTLELVNGTLRLSDSGGVLTADLSSVVVPTVVSESVFGEAGTVMVTQTDANTVHTVSLNNVYTDPVVILGLLEGGDPNPANVEPTTLRVISTTSNSFGFKLQEWNYQDGSRPGPERVSYMVIESGSYETPNGLMLQAGKVNASSATNFAIFSPSFSATPIVLAQTMSNNDPVPVTPYIELLFSSDMFIGLREEEGEDGSHASETIGYVALSPGFKGKLGRLNIEADHLSLDSTASNGNFQTVFDSVPAWFTTVQTNNGTDTVYTRTVSLTENDFSVVLQEEGSGDAEFTHTTETVGYVALETGDVGVYTTNELILADGTVLTGAADGHSLDASDGDPVDALFVDAEGGVGIGTTNPLAGLHVAPSNQGVFQAQLLAEVFDGDGEFSRLVFPHSIFVSNNIAYVASQLSDSLTVMDVSNPSNPILLTEVYNGDGEFNALDGARSVFVDGNIAYVASFDSNSLTIMDVSNPADPQLLAEVTNGTGGFTNLLGAISVYVSNGVAYVACNNGDALGIIDVSTPSAPTRITEVVNGSGGFNALDGPASVHVSDNVAYVASSTSSSLTIIDVNDPANPTLLTELVDGSGGFNRLNGAISVFVDGNFAYVASRVDDALTIIFVGNPSSPILATQIVDGNGGFNRLNGASGVYVQNNIAYVASQTDASLTFVDVTSKTSPTLLGEIYNGDGQANRLSGAFGVFVSGSTAYVAAALNSTVATFDAGFLSLAAYFEGGVGIGTSSPSTELEVNGTVTATSFAGDGSGLTGISSLDASDGSPANAVVVDLDGNVGIGVPAPDTALALQGNGGTRPVGITQNQVGGGATMELTTTDGSDEQATRLLLRGSTNDSDIEFYTGARGAEVQTLHIEGSNGRVGIGTNTPATALDVNGVVTASGLDTTGPITAGSLAATGAITGDSLAATGAVTAATFAGDGADITGVHSLDARDGDPVDVVQVTTGGNVRINGGNVGIQLSSSSDVPLHVGPVGGGTSSIEPVLRGLAKNGAGFTVMEGPEDIFVSGDVAYVVSRDFVDSLTMIDVSDPRSPVELAVAQHGVGGFNSMRSPGSVFVSGSRAYVTSTIDDSLTIVDVSDPANPFQLGVAEDGVNGVTALSEPEDVFVVGNTAYVAASFSDSLTMIDVSNPANPTQIGVADDGNGFNDLQQANSVFVSGSTAYVTAESGDGSNGGSLSMIDVSNPASPVLLGVAGNGAAFDFGLVTPEDVFVSGSTAYVASSGSSTLTMIDVSNPAAPTLLGVARDGSGFDELGGANSVAVSGSTAYVTADIDDALTVIDVSVPATPVQIAVAIDGQGDFDDLNGPGSVFVSDGLAYVTGYFDDAMSIIDDAEPTIPDGLIVEGSAAIGGTTLVAKAGTGRVGVNVDNPRVTLDVNGDAVVSGDLQVVGSSIFENMGNGATLAELRSERPWFLRQLGSGPATNLELFNSTEKSLIINNQGGRVGIGTTQPGNPFTVVADVPGEVGSGSGTGNVNPDNYVAHIRNTSQVGEGGDQGNTYSGEETGVLALTFDRNLNTASEANRFNWIQFFEGDNGDGTYGIAGAIENNEQGNVQYETNSADYAERLERLYPDEEMKTGDVVGVFGGKISKKTDGADWVMAVSGNAAVLGNATLNDHELRERMEIVGFIGQVPVWVQGTVRKGDYLVASGRNDGIAVAVSPQYIHPEQSRLIVGRAWQDSESPEVKLINAVVGLPASKDVIPSLLGVINEQNTKIKDLERRLSKIEQILSENTLLTGLSRN